MRAPVDTISAPPFPGGLPWVNVASLRMDKQQGRPVLVEFWDFARALSVRTLPYVRAWHERYASDGLRVIGVHAPGFTVSRDPDAVRAACARLEVEHPVLVDSDLEVWRLYGNRGWPARYLFGPELRLHSYHLGPGGFTDTELAVQHLLGVEREPLAPLRPEDALDAALVPPTPDQEGPWSGPYEAGAAWALVDGAGVLEVNGRGLAVDGPACLAVAEHTRHSAGVLDLAPGAGVTCHGVQFTPGVA
ncbi:MAG TPA: DipZ protein [Solirubrobacteraceae bacterium]|nr:DipZ protein [Solirubrobacteraceae bacterium]